MSDHWFFFSLIFHFTFLSSSSGNRDYRWGKLMSQCFNSNSCSPWTSFLYSLPASASMKQKSAKRSRKPDTGLTNSAKTSQMLCNASLIARMSMCIFLHPYWTVTYTQRQYSLFDIKGNLPEQRNYSNVLLCQCIQIALGSASGPQNKLEDGVNSYSKRYMPVICLSPLYRPSNLLPSSYMYSSPTKVPMNFVNEYAKGADYSWLQAKHQWW